MRCHRFRGEEGQALVITIFFLFVLLGSVAVTIDFSRILVARHQAQLAADAGALAAAQDLESTTATPATVTTDGSTLANDNDPGATVTISEPNGGTQAKADVTQSVKLPFGNVLGIGNRSVSASSVAQVQPNVTEVVDGDISPDNCTSGLCEYYATSSCTISWSGAVAGPEIGTGPWYLYTGYNTNTASYYSAASGKTGCSSVDLQDCNGAIGGTCLDQNGNPITNEVVDLNGNSPGGMYQTVTTTSGGRYVLSFLLSGNPAGESCAYDTFTGYVQINDNGTNGPQLAKQNFSHTNQCASNIQTATFQVVTVPFIAQSSQTTLIFQSTTCTTNGTDNSCPSSPSNYVLYGPQVTNVGLSYASVALAQ